MTERLYEGLFLVAATEAASEWTAIEGQIRAMIESHGATIEYAERWPEQRLAYPVKGVKRGVYFLAYFTSDTGAIASIRTDGQLNEKILRMLIIQEDFLVTEMAKRKESAARSAEYAAKKASAEAESTSADAKAADATVADATDTDTDAADADATVADATDSVPAAAGATDAGEAAVDAPVSSDETVAAADEERVVAQVDEESPVEEVANTEEETQ
ncbi:MAG: 30S ribosomal protein S6 [Planctomycetota bacterium]|nr:30S ribosomal protein S6 [Planctomycetota bacterium]